MELRRRVVYNTRDDCPPRGDAGGVDSVERDVDYSGRADRVAESSEELSAAVDSSEQIAPSMTSVVPTSEYLVLDGVERTTATTPDGSGRRRGNGCDEFKFIGRLLLRESKDDGDSSDDDDLPFDDGSD